MCNDNDTENIGKTCGVRRSCSAGQLIEAKLRCGHG